MAAAVGADGIEIVALLVSPAGRLRMRAGAAWELRPGADDSAVRLSSDRQPVPDDARLTSQARPSTTLTLFNDTM